jgi:putative transposase
MWQRQPDDHRAVSNDKDRAPRTDYLRTWDGLLDLACVIDCNSRRVVGSSMADPPRADFVIDALNMAVPRRRPEGGLATTPTKAARAVHGARVRSALPHRWYRRLDGLPRRLLRLRLWPGRRGGFHAPMKKKELLYRNCWSAKGSACAAVFDYIESPKTLSRDAREPQPSTLRRAIRGTHPSE